MNNGSAFLQGCNRIEDSRQLLIINLNELKRLLGLFKCIRRHRRHALTHESDAVLSQHADVTIAPPIEYSAGVGPREHDAHTGRFLRTESIDPRNARVRIRTAERLPPESSRQQHIGSVM